LTLTTILGRSAPPQTHRWRDRDYLLYALAIGMRAEPPQCLPFVFENGLEIVPTFPTVLAWVAEPTFESLGAHPDFALHSGQSIEMHRPLQQEETIAVSGKVVGVEDKGRERGAIIIVRQEIVAASDAQPIATLTTTCFARDCGGCGSGGEPAAEAHAMPRRSPDHALRYEVRPDAALLYRLTGDRNPLHADPAAARAAGFQRPILHGLCTFGMTCRAVLERVAEWRSQLIGSHSARFTAVVYPGDTLEIALWLEGTEVSFEARVAGRDVVAAVGKSTLRV
jgi:acyl dehydratase